MSKARAKGTSGENSAVEWLSAYYIDAERKALHGTRDSGDLTGLPFTVSVKRQESWSVHKWMKELKTQIANNRNKPGFIMARRNREEWMFLIPEETMKKLLLTVSDGEDLF